MAHNRSDKKLSPFTGRMIPSHIRDSKPKFEVFLKGFFKYLEKQGNPYDIITHAFETGDIDETSEDYIRYYKNTYAQEIPYNFSDDFRMVIKNIKSFYQTKGSEQGFTFLIQFLFGSDTSFYYPKEDILKTCDGTWLVPSYIRPLGSPAEADLLFYADTKVEGDVTGATAWVENLLFRDDPANPGTPILHFKVVESSITGTFANGEGLTIIDANKDTSSYTKIYIDNQSAGIDGFVQTAGYWLDRSGWLSDKNKLQDNYYYQDFSYVVVSEVSAIFYKRIVREILHPAGYEIFGELRLSSDDAIDTEVLPSVTDEWTLIKEKLESAPIALSDGMTKIIMEELLDMQLVDYDFNHIMKRIDEIITNILASSTNDITLKSTDTVIVAMTLSEATMIANIMDVQRLPSSYAYYEANREDAPYNILFSPCMLDNVPLSAWEDTPDEVMPYVNNNVITSVLNTLAYEEQPTPTINQQYGKTLDIAGGGSRSIVTTALSPYDIYINTLDPLTGEQTLEQTLTQGSLPNYGLWDNVFNAAGDTLAVGLPTDNRAGAGSFWGSVEVWTRSGTTWTIEDIIDNPLAAQSTGFGTGCALSSDGNTLAIGCDRYDGTQSNEGAVYVYTRSGTTWTLEQIVVATTPVSGDRLGISVDLSDDGDRLIARGDQLGSGKIWIFDRSGSTWSQNNIITAGDPEIPARISGDGLIIAIGEPSFDVNKGRVFLYEETAATVWTLRDTIIPVRSGSLNEYFGRRMDLDATGDRIAIAAQDWDNVGAAFIFKRDTATSWIEEKRIDPPETTTGFAIDVAILDDGSGMLVGDSNNSNTLSLAGKVWTVYFDPDDINTGCSSL